MQLVEVAYKVENETEDFRTEESGTDAMNAHDGTPRDTVRHGWASPSGIQSKKMQGCLQLTDCEVSGPAQQSIHNLDLRSTQRFTVVVLCRASGDTAQY